jgi:hypothetical protein
MKATTIVSVWMLAGAGAVSLAAVDKTGSNLALNGSDTLFDVTNAVIAGCPGQFSDFASQGITYLGGGSGVGAGAMGLDTQQVSPMSRALKSTEYCSIASPASSTLSEGLLVGIDGVAIAANITNSCSSSVANGFGSAAAFAVTQNGTATGGTPTTCPGCDGSNNYTFANSFAALKVLYFGLTHHNTCSIPVRKSLIAVSVGIGTLSTVPTGAAKKSNPFCNSADATAAVATTSFGGSSDFAGPGSGPDELRLRPGRGLRELQELRDVRLLRGRPGRGAADPASGLDQHGGGLRPVPGDRLQHSLHLGRSDQGQPACERLHLSRRFAPDRGQLLRPLRGQRRLAGSSVGHGGHHQVRRPQQQARWSPVQPGYCRYGDSDPIGPKEAARRSSSRSTRTSAS